MKAEDQLRDGNLKGALKSLQGLIRKQPENCRHRIFLFQLLAVLGQWQRALDQLNVIDTLDAGTLPMVHTYRNAIQCEQLRGEVFAGRRKPLIFGEPPQWVAWVIEALRLEAEAQFEEALSMRARAFDLAAESSGEIDGKSFRWIGDADARLGPVIEAVLNGHYYWLPVERIRAISIEPPADLRELVWKPAEFTWTNNGRAFGLIPARYPGSESSEDSAILMARKTEWKEVAEKVFQGLGQRMLATDEGDYPLLDIREVTIH